MWPNNKIYDITEYKNLYLNNLIYVTEKEKQKKKTNLGSGPTQTMPSTKKNKTTTPHKRLLKLSSYHWKSKKLSGKVPKKITTQNQFSIKI